MSAYGYQPLLLLPEMNDSKSSRRVAGVNSSDGRGESQYASGRSFVPASRPSAFMIEDYDISGHETIPSGTSQQYTDFVLFPPGGIMNDKTTHISSDYALGDDWDDYAVETRVPRSSLLSSAKRSGRKALGTHNKAQRHDESPRGHAPPAIDGHAAHVRVNRERHTERIYYPPSPPNAPEIHRLPTPDFASAGQSECAHGHHFCACCPPGSEAAPPDRKEGRSKMDRQSKCENSRRYPTFPRTDNRKPHIVADTASST